MTEPRGSSSSPICTIRAAFSRREETCAPSAPSPARSGARVLIDEVYLDAASPPRPSAVHLGPEFVCTSSLTKVYGLSGLRCGWILAEPELAERMWRLNDLFVVNQAHSAERLACIAFEHLDEVIGDNPAMLERNRDLFNEFVDRRGDLDCMPADARNHGFPAMARRRHRAARCLAPRALRYCDRSRPLVRNAGAFPHRLRRYRLRSSSKALADSAWAG